MKPCRSIIFPAFGILCLTAVTIPGSICAQAPAGPLPAAQPQAAPPSAANPQNQHRAETRTSILGQWKLNRDESDDPRKKMEDARTSRGSGSGGDSGVRIGGFPVGAMEGTAGIEAERATR